MSTRLGTAWDEIDERVGDSLSELLAVSQAHGVVPRSQIATSPPRADNFSKYKVCCPGDLVLNRFNAYRGALGVVPVAGMVSPDYLVVRPRDTADVRYLDYLLRSHYASSEMTKYMGGIGGNDPDTSGFSRIDVRALNRMEVPDRSAASQRTIADYLDRETARIDTLIEEQQRLIDLLHERRDTEADALLGSPVQARHTTVKRALRPLRRPAVAGLGVVTAFRDGVVTLRSNRREDGFTFSNTEHGYQEIRPGDLVFHALDGFAGAVGVSDSQGNATPVYHVCEATAGDDLAYVARLLRYLGRSGFLATQAPNVRERSVDFRNWSMFGRLPLMLPPVEEQRRVAAHLDEQNAKTDTLIAESERFVELARERRSALITAAVTGQIDVREML